MDDSDWEGLWERFHELAALAEPDREARLAALEPEQANRLSELLARHAAENGPLDRSLGLGVLPVDPNRERIGRTVGPYEIVSRLGAGGMGVVYEALQREPVERHVALKLIRGDLTQDGALARFEAERRAIAMMDHPAIARLFDAGTTADGELYFAMERIDGEPITRFCDTRRLELRARLDLFLRVCRGVQHAHERGIIHRDLKPSNILVTEQDGSPRPKIIDFGIARAAEAEGEVAVTRVGQVVGTPEYMSPEQSVGSGGAVDTRSDVYSLAVLLYELLTGTLPHDPETLRRASAAERHRMLVDTDPPTPSRRSVSKATAQRLRGDLDWIVMKGLAADPARRYRSPADLADDVERHLGDRPVLARPPSPAYQLGKLVRRHRVGVAVAAIALTGLVVAAAGVGVGLVRSRAEQRKAEVMQRFLSDTFTGVTPQKARGRDTVLLEEILEEAAARVESELADEPEAAGELHTMLARTYRALGRSGETQRHAEQAIALLSSTLGADARLTLEARDIRALALWEAGRTGEAIEAHRGVYEARRRTLGEEHSETLVSLNNLAIAVKNSGDLREAVVLFERCLEVRLRVNGPEDLSTRITISNLARAHQALGELDEAERLMRELVAMERERFGDDEPDTLHSIDILGGVLASAGKLEEAEALHREALAGMQRVFGPRHPTTNGSAFNLGKLQIRAGRHAEAETTLAQVETIVVEDLGPSHRYTRLARQYLAEAICLQPGRAPEALERFRALERATAEALPAEDPDHAIVRLFRAECLSRAGQASQARALAAEIRAPLVEAFGAGHRWIERLDAL